MNRVFDAIFPMIANNRYNSQVRKKIHPIDEEGKDIESEGILHYIENSE